MDYPILDFFDVKGFIGAEKYKIDEQKRMLNQLNINVALFVFSRDIENIVADKTRLKEFYLFKNITAEYKWYIYDSSFVIAVAGLGSTVSSIMMEVLGFMGIRTFFAVGSCGRILEMEKCPNLLVVDRAIRGEGTSYHYMKPSIYVETDKDLSGFVGRYLQNRNEDFVYETIWTTDSFFRETLLEVSKRKEQGAFGVDMECAGWCATAKYNGYKFAQLVYFSDAIQNNKRYVFNNKYELQKYAINLMIDCVFTFIKANKYINEKTA